VDDPAERELREPALALLVASTDVAVDAREPDLLAVLAVAGEEEVLAEAGPALVERDGVPDDSEVGIVRRVLQRDRVVDPAVGRDGVPDADEVRLALAAEGRLELARDAPVLHGRLVLEELHRVGDQVL